jgi:hypothetical protein
MSILITIGGEWDFGPEDVWPDGDAPDEFCAEDVAAVMRKFGKRRVIDDWGFMDEMEIEIEVPNPHWKQREALFPELAPSQCSRASVW